jgi:hemerythrin-like domain-containing protein
MATEFPGFSGPSASTEAPLEMLAACHIRIERQCTTLDRLLTHLSTQGCDGQAQAAAAKLIRYFDTAAVHHHADEEIDLFPALLESMAGSDAVCLKGLTDSLRAEHRQLESLWRRLRQHLQGIAKGESATLPADVVRQFNTLYAEHIQREEDELIPMAARLLSDQDIDRIGHAMRARRGLTGSDPTGV